MTTLVPPPTSYSPFQYHPGLTKLVLVSTTANPSYASSNLASYSFDGTTWVKLSGFPNGSSTNSGPPLCTNTSMAYDGTNLVLFSGRGVAPANYLNATWLMNSSGVWSASVAADTSPSTAPQARAAAYMAQQNGTTVAMWGGYDNHITFTDASAIFDYTEAGGWATSTLSQIPPCRLNGSVASNGTSQILFGFGTNIAGGVLSDLWSYNGTAWSQLTLTGISGTSSGGPSARHSASLTWNGTSYVLFGGVDSGGNFLNDTYTIGTTGACAKVATTNQPSVRGGHQAAYLPGTGVVVVGGENGSAYPLADVWILAVGGTFWTRSS